MFSLTQSQRMAVLDLTEAVVNQSPVTDVMVVDPLVVHAFLRLSKDRPDIVMAWVRLLTPEQLSRLTLLDVLTEEVMLELHLLAGFDHVVLVQWLRGLDFEGMAFFESIATQKKVLYLDQMMARAQLSLSVVAGVRIDSVWGHFESLDALVAAVLKKRISYKAFQGLLRQMNPDNARVVSVLDDMIKHHHVLKGITRSNQVYPLQVACVLMDYVTDATGYRDAVIHVIHQLTVQSTLIKSMLVVNQLPYATIHSLFHRWKTDAPPLVMGHLNKTVPQFNYGILRKIVRRHGFNVNYQYE